MNDDIFNEYCDKREIPEEMKPIYRIAIINSLDYQFYVLSIAIGELKQVMLNALPEWVKKILKGGKNEIK